MHDLSDRRYPANVFDLSCPASKEALALIGNPVLEDVIFNSFPQEFLGVTHVYALTVLVLDNLVPLYISMINVPNFLSFFLLFSTSKVPYILSLS